MLRRILNGWEKSRLFFIVLFSCLFFILGGFSFAQAAPETDDRTIKVGYYDYQNFLNVDGNGHYSGYIYEYLNAIAEYTGWKYQFIYGTLEECVAMLESGEIDLMTSLQKSPERENKFVFSESQIGMIYSVLCIDQSREDVYYEDFPKFNGMKVGVLRGSTIKEHMQNYAAKHNFQVKYAEFVTSVQMFDALHAGEIDALVTSSFASIEKEKIVARFLPQPGYFLMRKGNNALVQELDEACNKIFVENMHYKELLQNKYYGDSATFKLSFTRKEAELLKTQPELTVAYDPDWQPVIYLSEEEKKVKGIAVDFLQHISETSGLRFKFVQVENDKHPAQMVFHGMADIVCGYDQSMGDGRSHNLGLSKPYMELPLSFISLKGNMPDNFFKVGVVSNKTAIWDRLKKNFPGAVLTSYESLEEAVYAVSAGEMEYVVDNTYILQRFLQEPGNDNLQLLPYGQNGLTLSFGLSLDRNQELLNIFNKIIANMRPEERSHILISNIAQVPYHLTFRIFLKKYIYQIVASFILLFFSLLAYFFLLEKSKQKELSKIAFYDKVTGVRNFEKFKIDAEELVKSGDYVLVMFDINHFRAVTTGFGPKEAKRLLRLLCRNLERGIAPDEILAHGSNDLFLLLLRDTGDNSIRERLLLMQEDIKGEISGSGALYNISLAFGVYRPSKNENDLEKMMEFVDLARLEAKNKYRGGIVFYATDLGARTIREAEIENKMEQALHDHEFVVYFQPKYDLRTERPVGAEALVRWVTDQGIVMPGEFIELFERNGFVLKLDLYVFEQVCANIRKWLDEGLTILPISVNVSRLHLVDQDFINDYGAIINKYQIPPDSLELELTEHMPLASEDFLIETFNNLENLGVRLAMDDFGSGYSSLNVLHNMPFDTLKIDRLFFQNKTGSERGRRIIETIVFMAKRLAMDVVAEGVETKEQAAFLKAIGCNYVQGFLFAQAMPLEEFAALLRQESERG